MADDGQNDSLEALQKQVEALQKDLKASTDETERLRSHAAKILDEKKKLQSDYKAFSDLGDLETVQNLLKQFEGNEDAKLVAEGKFDEVLNKHTQRLKLDLEGKINELNDKLNLSETTSQEYARKYHEAEAGHAVRAAAVAAGVRDTAIDDILLRSKGIFTVSDDGTLEARDSEGNLRTINNKPLTPDLFVAGLRDKSPHYWPDSQGGGARGGSGVVNQKNPFKKGTKDYNVTEQAKLRKTNPELANQLAAEAAG